jgi:hypothetical protein
MIKNLCLFLLLIGFALIVYVYGKNKDLDMLFTRQPIKNVSIDRNKKDNIDPSTYLTDPQFDRMFIESSVWNNFDTNSINKIYRTRDLDSINVNL